MYTSFTFDSDNFKTVKVDVDYDHSDGSYSIDSITINGAYYSLVKATTKRYKAIMKYINERVCIDDMIQEEFDARREAYELRNL